MVKKRVTRVQNVQKRLVEWIVRNDMKLTVQIMNNLRRAVERYKCPSSTEPINFQVIKTAKSILQRYSDVVTKI